MFPQYHSYKPLLSFSRITVSRTWLSLPLSHDSHFSLLPICRYSCVENYTLLLTMMNKNYLRNNIGIIDKSVMQLKWISIFTRIYNKLVLQIAETLLDSVWFGRDLRATLHSHTPQKVEYTACSCNRYCIMRVCTLYCFMMVMAN